MDLPEVTLDLDLPPQLVLHPFLLHLGFEEHLQRHDELGVLLPGQVDVSEFPFAQRPPDLKVVDGEDPPWPGVDTGQERVKAGETPTPLFWGGANLWGMGEILTLGSPARVARRKRGQWAPGLGYLQSRKAESEHSP